uniref:Integrase catalytic domain-containing protein n=1 Tax=Strigamia maritima TaxID=126957 RepID=T1IQ24_STRMM
MWRYFTYVGKYRYLDVLQSLLKSYNNSVHRTLGRTPNEVTSITVKRNEKKQFIYKFAIDDQVRISKAKFVFRKGYTGLWSYEIYTVSERLQHYPEPVYRLIDYNKQPLLGTFYESELQKVVKPDEEFHSVEAMYVIVVRPGPRHSLGSETVL